MNPDERNTLIICLFVLWAILASIFLAYGLTMEPIPRLRPHSPMLCEQAGYCARI